ncbi:hypothetical protein ACFP2T_27225 [Plantactinospora solaniradicis]|uniref:Peptidase inhibitor family I36 protein n=1 Tax=Plantactinospora solaniradicis TaxID=1723736 RepID=A0ABW1KDM1_9ACTN
MNAKTVGVRIGTCTAFLVLAMVTGTAPAAAAPGERAGGFGERGQAVGLSREAGSVLQARADNRFGESREARTRGLARAADSSRLLNNCPYEYFCIYTGTSATGDPYGGDDMRAYWKCGELNLVPLNWRGLGSYYNNQTPGTRATFHDEYGEQIGNPTCAARCSVPNNPNWTEVWYVRAC